jgi:hypothetical protein
VLVPITVPEFTQLQPRRKERETVSLRRSLIYHLLTQLYEPIDKHTFRLSRGTIIMLESKIQFDESV